jgi:hypothetical protein
MGMKILQLKKKREELSKELERYRFEKSPKDEYSFVDKKIESYFNELTSLAEQIRGIEQERYINKLRSGLPTFYKFLHGNFHKDLFTVTTYRLLASCFGNIAHFDREGFLKAKFSSDDQIIETLETMITYKNEKSSTKELEKEIQEMISDSHILSKLKEIRTRNTIAREKLELKRLLDKYCSGEIPCGEAK